MVLMMETSVIAREYINMIRGHVMEGRRQAMLEREKNVDNLLGTCSNT